MIQSLVDMLSGLGTAGLLAVMAIEGSSFPFPGILIVLTYGYVLDLTLPKSISLALLMSLVYSATSYIPYAIGYKLEGALVKKFKTKLSKAQQMFRKYGLWSVALTRPFGIGNYISYVAGMCKVNAGHYGCLTFIGIFPWAMGMLWLGSIFKGNVNEVVRLFHRYEWYLYAALATTVLAYTAVLYMRQHRRAIRSSGERGGSDK